MTRATLRTGGVDRDGRDGVHGLPEPLVLTSKTARAARRRGYGCPGGGVPPPGRHAAGSGGWFRSRGVGGPFQRRHLRLRAASADERGNGWRERRREDFFLAQLVTFPADLAPGDYVLKVMLQDLLGGKANEAHTAFSVAERQLTSTAR
jgi:hypothetical protein